MVCQDYPKYTPGIAEEVLPDSQCGLRRGRGCVDMIFGVRQIIEKAVEHNTKILMLFIDL